MKEAIWRKKDLFGITDDREGAAHSVNGDMTAEAAPSHSCGRGKCVRRVGRPGVRDGAEGGQTYILFKVYATDTTFH